MGSCGSQIAAVTTPLRVAANGTLFVAVTTNAWMTEVLAGFSLASAGRDQRRSEAGSGAENSLAGRAISRFIPMS